MQIILLNYLHFILTLIIFCINFEIRFWMTTYWTHFRSFCSNNYMPTISTLPNLNFAFFKYFFHFYIFYRFHSLKSHVQRKRCRSTGRPIFRFRIQPLPCLIEDDHKRIAHTPTDTCVFHVKSLQNLFTHAVGKGYLTTTD